MATSESKLSMKLLIDTKERRVLFAEAEKDCVDFLFHILSMPVATVIRLLKEKGMTYGCLPNLYDSVQNLSEAYLQSNQNKDMLLKPKSSVGVSSAPLLLLNDVPTENAIYRSNSCSYNCTYFTDDPATICPYCRSTMSSKLTYVGPEGVEQTVATTGGFVKEVVTFMVMDDLVVKPMSTISSITILNKFNVKDVGVLQEEVVSVGMEEALKLLKASFESKMVLTSVFMSLIKASK